MSVTLLELRTQARQRADMENSQFITDAELNSYINNSIAELHDLLIQHYKEDYIIEEHNFTTVSGTKDYSLPMNFYKLRGVDAELNGSDKFTIQQFNFNERNRFEDFGVWTLLGIASVRYRLVGSNIRFSPVPDQATPVTLWYIPVATKLVNDSDTYDDINAYAEYVIIDAAIKMLQKEESDVSVLAAQKAAMIQRIEAAAADRDAANPQSVSDIYAENNDFYFWRTTS